jgi:hypothetical protein
MFRASSCPTSGATTTGLPSELGNRSAVGRVRAGRPDHDQQHWMNGWMDGQTDRQMGE